MAAPGNPRAVPAWVLPGLCVVLFCALAWSLGACTQDDAYISFRYARHLAQGDGLVFNPGERVEGYTNFLWTVLLAGGIALGLDPVPLSRLLGIACGALLVALTALLAARAVPEHPRRARWLAALPLAATPSLAAEAAMGLETALFALLVLAGLLRASIEARRPGAFPCFALLLAAAALTRPEGTLVLLVVVAVLALSGRDERRLALRGLIAYGALVLSHFTWRWGYYGQPLPNTFYAKVGGGPQLARGLEYLREQVDALLWFVPAVALLAARRRRQLEVRLLGALCVVYTAYVTAVGGDFKATFRFFVPILAPLWILFAVGAGVLVDALAKRWRGLLRAARVLALPAGACLVLLFGLSFAQVRSFAARRRAVLEAPHLRAAAAWFRANTPPDAALAQAEAGLLPYLSDVRTIDLWGLTDPHIARSRPGDAAERPVGHRRGDAEYVLSRRPLYFVPVDCYGPRPRGPRDLRSSYPVERELLRHPSFLANYRLVNLRLGKGFLTFFQLREDPEPGAIGLQSAAFVSEEE